MRKERKKVKNEVRKGRQEEGNRLGKAERKGKRREVEIKDEIKELEKVGRRQKKGKEV